MVSDKKIKSTIAIYAIVAAVLIILTLVIPFNKPTSSWIMFGFTLLSLIIGAFTTIYAFDKSEKLMSKFYGYPLFRVGYIYTLIQIISTLVIYIVGAFVEVPYWVGVVLSILTLGFVGVGCITADNVRDYIQEIDNSTLESTKNITLFQTDIADILDLCETKSIKEPLINLVKKFKYSDPVSTPQTEEAEKNLKVELQELRALLAENDSEKILSKIKTISNQLNSRNRICESSK